MGYITFNEGVIDSIKDTANSVANHVGNNINNIKKAAQDVSGAFLDRARQVSQNVSSAADTVNQKINSVGRTFGSKGFKGEHYNSGTAPPTFDNNLVGYHEDTGFMRKRPPKAAESKDRVVGERFGVKRTHMAPMTSIAALIKKKRI